MAQDKEWEKELFRMMKPFKKNWCSHTIDDDPEILDLAAQAGAWYVYQAVLDDSDFISAIKVTNISTWGASGSLACSSARS